MTEYNMSERLVKCPMCQKEEMTNRLNPQCEACHVNMITIIKSHFSNKELVLTNFVLKGVKQV